MTRELLPVGVEGGEGAAEELVPPPQATIPHSAAAKTTHSKVVIRFLPANTPKNPSNPANIVKVIVLTVASKCEAR